MDENSEFFDNFSFTNSKLTKTIGNRDHLKKCRFCLKSVDNEISINENMKKHFEVITNSVLDLTRNLSKIACKNCRKMLKKCNSIRKQLLENQRILLDFLDMEDSFEQNHSEVEIKEEAPETMDTKPETAIINEMSEFLNFTENFKEEPTENPETLTTATPQNTTKISNTDKLSDLSIDKAVRSNCKRKYLKVLCIECGNYFPRFYLKNHIERVHLNIPAVRNFQCDLCEKNYSRKNQLKDHILSHMSVKQFQCKMCSMQFYTQNRLSMHIKNFHYQKYQTYCEYCAKYFKYQATYNDHVKRYHTLEKAFRCTECDKTFFTGGELKSHIGCVHANEPVTCVDCGKVCRSAKALKSHRRCHFEKVLKFKCTFENCFKRFQTNAYLQQHLKVHLGQKDFECPECGQDYYKNTDLKRHIRSIHMKIKLKCEIADCKSQFARKETYRNHVLSHHKDIGEQNVTMLLEKIRSMQLPEPGFVGETQ